MKTIRVANRYDIEDLLDLMRHYSSDSPLQIQRTEHNSKHVTELLTYIIMGQGRIFVALVDTKVVGLLISIRQPNVWNRDIYLLQELAWYVLPEYRNTTIGYRLYKAYEEYAHELLNNNKISAYTLSKMTISPNLKYEKLGLEKIEETWLGK